MSPNEEFINLARQTAIEEVQYGIEQMTGEQISEEQALALITDENSAFHQCLMEDMQHLPDEQVASIMQAWGACDEDLEALAEQEASEYEKGFDNGYSWPKWS